MHTICGRHPECVAVPVQLHFPVATPIPGFDDLGAARDVAQRLRRSGVHAELVEYAELDLHGHGFLNGEKWWEDWKERLLAANAREPFEEALRQRAVAHVLRFIGEQVNGNAPGQRSKSSQ